MKDLELDKLLELAQVKMVPHGGFQREVWLRIEVAETKGCRPRLSQIAERLFTWLALPPVALATCSLMLAAGVWSGLESGNLAPQGKMAYVQSISPFAQSHR